MAVHINRHSAKVDVTGTDLSALGTLLSGLFPGVPLASASQVVLRRETDDEGDPIVRARIEYDDEVTIAEAKALKDAGEFFNVLDWSV